VQHRKGLARELCGAKHESGSGGDGYPLGFGGQHPREDENQEGNGLCLGSKPALQRYGFPRGDKALEVSYPSARKTSWLLPMLGPTRSTASVPSPERETPGGLAAGRKGAGILGRSKALKVAIPGAARTEMCGRHEGEQGVKGGSNSEGASCSGLGAPGVIRTLCVGDR
jgi:hypothetical protein